MLVAPADGRAAVGVCAAAAVLHAMLLDLLVLLEEDVLEDVLLDVLEEVGCRGRGRRRGLVGT